ncbi:MAG: hypothetical protein ACE37N_14850 [Pseudohongiellaceae bacterium]
MAAAVATPVPGTVITDVILRLQVPAQPPAQSTFSEPADGSDLEMEEGFDVGLEMSGNASAFNELMITCHEANSILVYLKHLEQVIFNS